MDKIILTFFVLIMFSPTNLLAENKYINKKHHFSFLIPKNWHCVENNSENIHCYNFNQNFYEKERKLSKLALVKIDVNILSRIDWEEKKGTQYKNVKKSTINLKNAPAFFYTAEDLVRANYEFPEGYYKDNIFLDIFLNKNEIVSFEIYYMSIEQPKPIKDVKSIYNSFEIIK